MAAKKKPTVTANEKRFAYQLLHYLGGDTTSGELILAIIAWMRKESGSTYIGNNPLNIRNSRFASSYRNTKGNGHFAVFKNMAVAARATAAFLMENKGHGYDKVIAALKPRGLKPTDYVAQQKQATDFLLNLALSDWSRDHYGLTGVLATQEGAIYSTVIWKLWSSLHTKGLDLTLPADSANPWTPKPKPPPPAPKPRPGIDEYPFQQPHNYYLDPHEARRFYEARNQPLPPLPGEPYAPS